MSVVRDTRALACALAISWAFGSSARADDVAPETAADAPLSGWHDGLFFLRNRADNFRLYVQGRVHVDGITWLGPGVRDLGPDSALKTTLFLRRVRPEIGGEFFRDWQWQLSVDFGPSSTDNPVARTDARNCSVDASSGAQTCSDQSSAVEAPGVKPAPTDAFVNYGPTPWFNVQVGQFLVPFTMENRISDNTTPFLERSLVARGLGAPFTRDIGAMVWGEAPNHLVYWSLGAYDGDGPNRPNVDNRFDGVARAFVRPFAANHDSPLTRALEHAQVGASGRYGSRDTKLIGYDVPSLTTQGGYAFWRGTYRDAQGRTEHIVPSGEQGAVGGDIYLPVNRFDVTSELVYAVTNTRETIDGYQLSPFTERYGRLRGYAYYVQVGAWVYGSRDVIGFPSYGRPLHADFTTPERTPSQGVQLLAKLEQLHLAYGGAARSGTLDAKTPDGDIDVVSLAFGANYWATRHVRVGLNYVDYMFPHSAPLTASRTGGSVQNRAQRAVAPAQALARGINDGARDGGHALHEVSTRVGIQF